MRSVQLIAATSCLLALGSIALPGCQAPRPTLTEDQQMALWDIAKANKPNNRDQTGFSGMDWSLGVIETRGLITPLTSPDGLWVATETGPELASNTLMALPNSPIPTYSGIQITRIDGTNSKLTPQYVLPAPLILGQSADANGFLVEQPRIDGSRWIGKVAWETGKIEWLVQDDKVNAFGSLGPDGELAWCTRSISDPVFSLAIRFTDGEEIGIAANGGEWLMPSWSTRSKRISIFFLSDDGIMSILSLDCRTPELVTQQPRRHDLMTGANRQDAYKARQSHPVIQGTPPGPLEEVVFYHPTLDAIYLWLPMSSLKTPPMALATESLVATRDPGSAGFLIGTRNDLRWQDPDNRKVFVRVRYGPSIPRVTNSRVTPYLLFIPGSNGMEVRAMIPEYSVPDALKES